MSRKIIIVTEHGYDYDRDGQLFITNAMKDQYGVAAQTHFFSGPLFCKIKSIVGAIELPHEDTFVIWAKDSTDTEAGSLRIFPPETLDQLAKNLVDPKYDGKTAWEILCTIMEEEDVTNL